MPRSNEGSEDGDDLEPELASCNGQTKIRPRPRDDQHGDCEDRKKCSGNHASDDEGVPLLDRRFLRKPKNKLSCGRG